MGTVGSGMSIERKGFPLACVMAQLQPRGYLANKEAFTAQHLGVSLEEYTVWLELEGIARCSALTQKGARCRNMVSGGTYNDVQEWRRKDQGYCTVHGGETSADVEYEYRKRLRSPNIVRNQDGS